MSWLSREQVKSCVEEALHEVADWTGAVDEYNISELSEEHQIVFMNAIEEKLEAKGIGVTLNPSKLRGFAKFGKLIDYIEENQTEWLKKPKGWK